MTILDLIIAIAAVGYAFAGFRHGAVVGVLSMVGFFGGAAGGAQLAQPLTSRIAHDSAQIPVAIACVLLCAVVGQLVGSWIGRLIRRQVISRLSSWGRRIDSIVGAAFGVATVLVVAWVVAVPLASTPYPGVASAASRSRIVRAVNKVMPNSAHSLYYSMRDFLDNSGFPPVFGDLPSSPGISVAAPSDTLSPSLQAEVNKATPSVVKIYGEAPSCDRGIEGSGFVFAPHRVMTNAHVVAGTSKVELQLTGETLPAKVVLFDANRDIAVLDVPGLNATPLPFAGGQAAKGSDAAVLGYPQNGPFTIRSARVGDRETIGGSNIYGHGDVHREIYTLRAVVRSGNSGGPVIGPNGDVLGVVFATSLEYSDVGYALTDGEVASDAAAGRTATAPVSTSSCTPG